MKTKRFAVYKAFLDRVKPPFRVVEHITNTLVVVERLIEPEEADAE
jgi:hypothetical protein